MHSFCIKFKKKCKKLIIIETIYIYNILIYIFFNFSDGLWSSSFVKSIPVDALHVGRSGQRKRAVMEYLQ